MIKSYFTIALRSFRRGRFYSFINLFGLAVGLASVMLIIAYIGYELSFDKYFANSDRIYQLVMESRATDPIERTVHTPEPLGRTLVEEFAEIESSVSLTSYKPTFLVNDKPVPLKAITVNPNFFEFFDFHVIKGSRSSALSDKSGVVLTKETAEKLFPNEDVIGKTLSRRSYSGTTTFYNVTAVIDNIPANTHFNVDIILSQAANTQPLDFRGYSSSPQYLLLKPQTDSKKLEAKFQAVLSKYNLNKDTHIQLLPLTDIHLRSGKVSGSNSNASDIRYVYIFGSVALLILLIGCINYVNLTTAQALQRVKEVGVRKTLGSGRGQLAFQFIGESFLFFTLAIIVAIFLAITAWPFFNNFLQVSLPVNSLFSYQNILIFLAIALFSGLVSGIYPALFLSRMQPAGILKDRQAGLKINLNLRKVLIVFQFSISMVLIIATIVVWQQLDLFNNRPLGFRKDHLLMLPSLNLQAKPDAFKKRLLDNPNVASATFATLDLGGNIGNSSSMSDPADSTRRLNFGFIYADFDFVETMGIKLKSGRGFSEKYPGDRTNYDSLYSVARKQPGNKEALDLQYQSPIVITESLAKTLRLKQPINEVLRLGALQGKVIGVVKDFQVTTLKELSPLLVYKPKLGWFSTTTYVRLNNHNIPESISYIEKTWKEFFPDQPFQCSFADDNLQKLYESENRLASIFSSFALLAIGISALGLFSLVALIVKQRTKEIGIRKVMGASVSGIALLLSKDFVKLILFSAVIASPIAWYGMSKWLQDFANRVEIQWWMFVLAGTLAVLTGLITVSLQTIKAAKMNPVDSLKTE